ncbi:5-hydroxytryptamine receptor-like, partial [Ctenocephalides felis]|uniref:5-hydroxytryptamine receptor-like n=1 Tax=Ctenocephalides felis TaxID=7515 RepID=UPI000E6E1E49
GYDYFFIDGGGGGPESLLRALGIGSLPNTTYYDIDNGLISNNTLLAQNLSIQNGSFIAETPNDGSQPLAEVIVMTVTSVVLGLMILITVIGNVFVIAAIILERNLQNVANYLVASLAVADLMVACLVMPLGAVYE